MRLGLIIRRHDLPPTTVLWTPQGFAVDSRNEDCLRLTVSEFLEQVNEVVPLEYAEWGLEDYVVEVNGYECLHFQELGTVFNEDDEVQIRALKTADLRNRKLSGRNQISRDGKHLIDGVAFGRRYYKRSMDRPPVVIPPRKRIRLMTNADYEDSWEVGQAPEGGTSPKLITNTMFGEEELSSDDEDDEDFQASGSSSESECGDDEDSLASEDLSEDIDNERKRKKQKLNSKYTGGEGPEARSKGALYSALADSNRFKDCLILEDGAILPLSQQPASCLILEDGTVVPLALDSTLQSDISMPHLSSSTPAVQSSSRSKARKRLASQPINGNHPVSGKSSLRPSSKTSPLEGGVSLDVASHEADDPIAISQTHLSHPSPSSTPQRRVRAPPTDISAPNPDLGVSSKSSISSSFRLSDDTSSDLASDSSSAADSSSSSESESESSSDSSSGSSSDSSSESDSDSKSKKGAPRRSLTVALTAKLDSPTSSTSLDINKNHGNVRPGGGNSATKKRNERRKRHNHLQTLKLKGILPPDASFVQYNEYLMNESSLAESSSRLSESALTLQPSDFESRRQALLRSLDAGGVEVAVGDPATMTSTKELENPSGTLEQISSSTQQGDETRRSRLDLASTRRLLFGSLGLRAPKTKNDERKISERLMKLAKPLHKYSTSLSDSGSREIAGQRNLGPSSDQTNGEYLPNDTTPWETKISLTAEECVEEDLVLSAPPFPFQQRWDPQPEHQYEVDTTRKQGKKQRRNSRKEQQVDEDFYKEYYENGNRADEDAELNYDEPATADVLDGAVSDQIMRDVEHSVRVTHPDLPILPSDVSILPSLALSDIMEGAIIAFRRLALSDNFEPQISNYQTAEVKGIPEDGAFPISLAKRDIPRVEKFYDEETGKRVYQKLQAPDDDEDCTHVDQMDGELDGHDQVTFEELIEPKLVRASCHAIMEFLKRHSKSPSVERSSVASISNSKGAGLVSAVDDSINALIPATPKLAGVPDTDQTENQTCPLIKVDVNQQDLTPAKERKEVQSTDEEPSDVESPQFHGFTSSPSVEDDFNVVENNMEHAAVNGSSLRSHGDQGQQLMDRATPKDDLTGRLSQQISVRTALARGSGLFLSSSPATSVSGEEIPVPKSSNLSRPRSKSRFRAADRDIQGVEQTVVLPI